MGFLRTFFLLFCIAGIAQNGGHLDDQIIWNKARKLTWNDFKAEPPADTPVAALTASGISYSFSSVQNGDEMEIRYIVTANFYPNRSWYQPKYGSSNVLAHEQLHFDITELFARKFRQRLDSARFTKDIKAEVRTIFQQINRELSEYQDRYDLETNSSRLLDRQREWQLKVREAMAATPQ